MEKSPEKKIIQLEYDAKDICAIYRFESFFKKNIDAGNKIPARVLKKLFQYIRFSEKEKKKLIDQQFKNLENNVFDRFSNDPDYRFTQTRLIENIIWDDFKEPEDLETIVDLSMPELDSIAARALEGLTSQVVEKNNRITLFDDEENSEVEKAIDELNLSGIEPKPKKKTPKKRKVVYDQGDMFKQLFSSVKTYFAISMIKIKPDQRKNYLAKHIFQNLLNYRKNLTGETAKFLSAYKLQAITAFILQELALPVSAKKNPTNQQLYQGVKHTLKDLVPKKTKKTS